MWQGYIQYNAYKGAAFFHLSSEAEESSVGWHRAQQKEAKLAMYTSSER